MKKIIFLALMLTVFGNSKLFAQDPFIGEIKMFAGNFAPQGWALCNGQTLSIQQNTALFSILGTTYGGNGTTSFGLPDLRGRVAIGGGYGAGPGLTSRNLGELSGTENTTILVSNMPAHTHSLTASTVAGNTNIPTNAIPADTGALDKEYTNLTSNTSMQPTGSSGNGIPINNMQPYLGMTFIIATQGIYPSHQ
jgi:microcystin-dependent protein